jgi:putative membrane protein
MSIRRLMATAAGALAIATGTGQMNSLQAQNAAADFKADNAFVSQVAAANLMEVRLGQLAASKAQTPAVKDFGNRMVSDHTSLQQLWMAAARKNGAPFNARYTTEQQQEILRLNRLSGPQFEQAYMDLMVQDHQKDLNAFQTQGRAARSAEVRDLVERAIPTLQYHYNLATQVRSQINGGAAVATNQPAQQPTPAGQNSPWENVKKDGSTQPTTQPAQQPTPTQQPAPTTTAGTTPGSTPSPVATTGQYAISAEEIAFFKQDAKFIREVAADHLLEQRLGELAALKAENPSVKQYGRKMVTDHTMMQEKWTSMATRNGMPITPGIGKNHQAKLNKLQKKSGKAFDKEYMTLEVWNHKDYINYFQREGLGARSSAVRDMVRRDTPMLMEDFNLAKQLGAQVNADVSAEIRTSSR